MLCKLHKFVTLNDGIKDKERLQDILSESTFQRWVKTAVKSIEAQLPVAEQLKDDTLSPVSKDY